MSYNIFFERHDNIGEAGTIHEITSYGDIKVIFDNEVGGHSDFGKSGHCQICVPSDLELLDESVKTEYEFKVGDRVLCRRDEDEPWKEGVIETVEKFDGADDQPYQINDYWYYESDVKALESSEQLPEQPKLQFQVGDKVEVQLEDGSWVETEIEQIDEDDDKRPYCLTDFQDDLKGSYSFYWPNPKYMRPVPPVGLEYPDKPKREIEFKNWDSAGFNRPLTIYDSMEFFRQSPLSFTVSLEGFPEKPTVFQKVKNLFKRRKCMNHIIADLFPKTKDALLVEEELERYFQNPLLGITLKGKEAEVLELAKKQKADREAEENE
jgi:hypothetical protein